METKRHCALMTCPDCKNVDYIFADTGKDWVCPCKTIKKEPLKWDRLKVRW